MSKNNELSQDMYPNKHLESNVLHLSCLCAVFSFKLGKHLCLCGTLPEALSYDGTTSHITTAHKCRVIFEDQAISVIPCCRYLLSPRAHLTIFNSIQILKLTSVSQMHNCNNTNLKKWHTWPKACACLLSGALMPTESSFSWHGYVCLTKQKRTERPIKGLTFKYALASQYIPWY